MDIIRNIFPDSSKERINFELNKKYSFKGFWWVPTKNEEKKYGILYFDHLKGLILEIIEDFDIRNEMKENERKSFADFLNIENNLIEGILCNGEIITLTGCTKINTKFSLLGIKCDSILAEKAFIGTHFNKPEDIKFKSVSANFVYLNQWVDISGFSGSYEPASEITITYKYKEPVSIDIKDNFKLLIETRAFGPKLPLKKEVKIRQRSYIKIIPKKCKSLDEYLKLFGHIQSFLSLAVRKPVYPYIIEGIQELETEETNNRSVLRPVKILFSIRDLSEKYDEISKYDMLFTFSDVSDRLEIFLNKWFANAELLKPIYDIHFLTLDDSYSFLQNQFLNLVQAIESFHRIFECNEEIDKKEYDKRIKIILNAIPRKYKKWLKFKLKRSNEPSLKLRLEEIIGRYSKITRKFIKDDESFSEKVSINRNYLSHLDPSSRDRISEPGELFDLLQKLKILLLISLLGLLGFSIEEIEKMLVKEKWFNRVCKDLDKGKVNK